jgi:hypothetical protein
MYFMRTPMPRSRSIFIFLVGGAIFTGFPSNLTHYNEQNSYYRNKYKVYKLILLEYMNI